MIFMRYTFLVLLFLACGNMVMMGKIKNMARNKRPSFSASLI